MPEVRERAVTVYRKYVCDACGEGELKPTGRALSSNPPKIEHACSRKICNMVKYLPFPYPVVTHMPESEFDGHELNPAKEEEAD